MFGRGMFLHSTGSTHWGTECLSGLEEHIAPWERTVSFLSVLGSLTISWPQIYKMYRWVNV